MVRAYSLGVGGLRLHGNGRRCTLAASQRSIPTGACDASASDAPLIESACKGRLVAARTPSKRYTLPNVQTHVTTVGPSRPVNSFNRDNSSAAAM